MFQRILIANRGEIALRIIRACRELEIETVGVFSEEDREADYLSMTDRAICIGGPAPADSYLKSDRIIAAAEVYRSFADRHCRRKKNRKPRRPRRYPRPGR